MFSMTYFQRDLAFTWANTFVWEKHSTQKQGKRTSAEIASFYLFLRKQILQSQRRNEAREEAALLSNAYTLL